jgi:hypothetical protein
VSSRAARPGQTITIPATGQGQAIFARVHGMAVSGIEKIETLVYRAHLRHALINGTETARIVPGTAEDGLLFDVAPESDYPAPLRSARTCGRSPSPVPRARTGSISIGCR